MTIDIRIVAVALFALALGYLLLKFGQVIAKFLLILGGLIVAGIFALALLEQARATRAVAATAAISATGQAATSAILSAAVVLILFLLVAGGAVAAYLYLRRQRQRRQRTAWTPGPYAYWGQQAGSQAPTHAFPPSLVYPYPPAAPYPPQAMIPYQVYPVYPPYSYPAYPVAELAPEEDEDIPALPWW